MWIKDYRGMLHNLGSFKEFKIETKNSVQHILYGVEMNGNKSVLLEYISLRDEGFERVALTKIESGIVNNEQLVKLNDICRTHDYTEIDLRRRRLA